jgi:outer membrane protein TolC
MSRVDRRALNALLLVALAAGALSSPAPAQTGNPPARPELTNPDSTLAITLQQIPGSPIGLEDAQKMALVQATDVRTAEAVMHAARGALRHESGAFDPELFLDADRVGVEQPTASPFSGGDSLPSGASLLRTTTTRASTGARVKLPTGTELTASLLATKLETNSTFALLNPEYDASGVLSVRQPLLKGFGPGTWGDRSAAKRDYEAARARFEDAVLATRALVERTYWDLYAAERDYGVQQIITDRAAALLNETQLRARAGLVGPGAVASARVFYTQQEQSLLDFEETLDRTSDRLATLVGQRPPGDSRRYKPSDEPPRDFTVEPEETLVRRAVDRSRELQGAERDLAAARARERGAWWNMLPTLDVRGSLGGTGLAGTGRDFINPFTGQPDRIDLPGNFSQTWAQIRGRDFPTWSAGLSVSVPIGFRAGAGDHQRRRAEADIAEQRAIATRRSLEERVRAAYRELEHASKRMEAAQNGVNASLEQVRIGLIEFRNGRTTAFELTRVSADLATAQQRYSQALVRTAKAYADLRRLTSEGLPPARDHDQGGD